MNKYQEAYERLSKRTFKHYKTFEEVFDDIDILGELVKKATPKKPLLRKDGYDDGSEICDTWDCPNCGETFVIEDDADKCNYCPNCSQKLDWSVEE